jgi:hypothetical protein
VSAEWTSLDEMFDETYEARERRYEAERERRRKAAAELGRKEREARIRKIVDEVADSYRLTPEQRRAFQDPFWMREELASFEDVRTLQRHVQQIIEELRSESA